MNLPSFSRFLLTGMAALYLSLSPDAMAAPLLYETFDGLTNGQISGQTSWILGSGGDAALSQVVEDADIAYSSPKFLSLVGSNGSSANVLYALPSPPTLTDTMHNHLQFFFRAENAQDGSGRAPETGQNNVRVCGVCFTGLGWIGQHELERRA